MVCEAGWCHCVGAPMPGVDRRRTGAGSLSMVGGVVESIGAKVVAKVVVGRRKDRSAAALDGLGQ